jgi:hypothetical protein
VLSASLQVGLMLKGAHIDNIVFGGPGYNSQVLSKGDKIVKVDGKDVTVRMHDLPRFRHLTRCTVRPAVLTNCRAGRNSLEGACGM